MRVLWKSRLFRISRKWYFDFDSSHTISQYSNLLLKTIATFSLTFAVTVLATSVFSPVTTLNATDVTINADVSHGAYTLSLSVDKNVTLDLNPTVTGVMSVDNTTVTTNTTSPSGYKLYLGMNSNTNDLIHSTDNTLRISSVSGTFDDAAALSSNSSWGYAISSDASTIADDNDFDDAYITGSSITPNANKFAAVPANTDPLQLIAETNHPNTTTADDLDVYYGVLANYATHTGTYTNQVQYTAIADNGASHGLYISPEQTPAIDGGDTLTVTTTLYSTATTINSNVYLLTATELANVHNDTPISAYNNKKLTCSRDTTAPTLTLSCTSIAAPIGNYFIYVDVPDYGEYYETAFNYVNQTFFTITKMQEMTPEICNAVTTPVVGAQYEDTTGAYAGNPNFVPTRVLLDDRLSDGQRISYTVRKLADGKCWMTENLRLTNTTLTSDDSNVPAGTTVTIPASSTANWCSTNSSACDDQLMTMNAFDAASGGDPNHPEYGTYYN